MWAFTRQKSTLKFKLHQQWMHPLDEQISSPYKETTKRSAKLQGVLSINIKVIHLILFKKFGKFTELVLEIIDRFFSRCGLIYLVILGLND